MEQFEESGASMIHRVKGRKLLVRMYKQQRNVTCQTNHIWILPVTSPTTNHAHIHSASSGALWLGCCGAYDQLQGPGSGLAPSVQDQAWGEEPGQRQSSATLTLWGPSLQTSSAADAGASGAECAWLTPSFSPCTPGLPERCEGHELQSTKWPQAIKGW